MTAFRGNKKEGKNCRLPMTVDIKVNAKLIMSTRSHFLLTNSYTKSNSNHP